LASAKDRRETPELPVEVACPNILITGASGGIGAALAIAYASTGIRLALIGRNEERLAATAMRCRARGAEVVTACLDVTDQEALAQWIGSHDQRFPLDLVIANAGVSSTIPDRRHGESWADICQVFDTNVRGALATIHPALAGMRARGRGQIALMSSLGGFVGMAISPSYNASKAAIKVYGEGLRGWLAPQGVGVTVICPGFVKSAMSDAYPGPRPFMISADRAADIIKKGLAGNPARIAFPFPLALAMWFLAALPPAMSLALQRMFRF
jgi:short-subunit dehydrogenase